MTNFAVGAKSLQRHATSGVRRTLFRLHNASLCSDKNVRVNMNLSYVSSKSEIVRTSRVELQIALRILLIHLRVRFVNKYDRTRNVFHKFRIILHFLFCRLSRIRFYVYVAVLNKPAHRRFATRKTSSDVERTRYFGPI